jgi:DNA-binding transcriptional ArsR family regulator
MITPVEKLAKILKVLGDPNRLNIVMSIGRDSRSVTEIINVTGLSQTLVSFHLKALRTASIVKTERDGPFIYYSLADTTLVDILDELSDTAESLESAARKAATSSSKKFLEKQRR